MVAAAMKSWHFPRKSRHFPRKSWHFPRKSWHFPGNPGIFQGLSLFIWLSLSMLRLLLSEAQELKNLWKSSKPCHLGIHWKALIAYSQMSTHLPGFRSFFSFFTLFCFDQISHQQHKGYSQIHLLDSVNLLVFRSVQRRHGLILDTAAIYCR